MEKIRIWLASFMRGRYGYDQLCYVLVVSGVVISLISSIFFEPNIIVSFVVILIFVYVTFRALSRNIWKRRQENMYYMNLVAPMKKRFSVIKSNILDKEKKRYLCPKCEQMVRVPKGKGKIEITCPKCGRKFVKRT